jgi:uncharacterized protein
MTHTVTPVTPQPGERLIEDALFRLDDAGTPWLRGSRCPRCGDTLLGKRVVCLGCFNVGLESADLSDRGEVYSFTTVRQQSPDSLISPPYVVVQVKLAEGVIVTSPLLESPDDQVFIGMPVRTKAFRFTEPSGDVLVSYAFVPVTEQGGNS